MYDYDFETLIDRTSTGASKWEKMRRLKPAVGADIVPLSVADMDFITAPEIREGLKDFIDHGVLGYIYANRAYREAVMAWMATRHHWPIQAEWVVPSPGVVPALYHAVKTYTAPGDGVIIMTPVYYPFFTAVKNAGRTLLENTLVNINNTGRYEIDFDALESLAALPTTTMLIFCSPHNPVGRVWTRAEVEKVAHICLKHHLLLVSDEIHFDFLFDIHEHTVIARVSSEIADNCIIATSPSKTFNLAGLQTANLIIPNAKIRHTYEQSFEASFSDWNLPVLGGKACELAYTKGEPWLEALLAKIAENAKAVEDTLRRTPIIVTPLEGTYLLWLDCRPLGLSPRELEKRMIAADVFADEGYIFGKSGAGFERLNLACPTRYIRAAAERMGIGGLGEEV